MSNLLKYSAQVNSEDGARVIDNNEMLEEIVREKMRQMQAAEAEEGFSPGLNAEEVDLSMYSEDGEEVLFEGEEDGEYAEGEYYEDEYYDDGYVTPEEDDDSK